MKFVIVIRFTGSFDGSDTAGDVEVPININFERDDVNRLISVQWLKKVIREKHPGCSKRRLRLIYNGRVLNELTDFRGEIFGPRLKPRHDSSTPPSKQEKLYIHCAVGDELTTEQLIQETQWDNAPQQVSTAPAVIGFDRLLQQGFSREDIADLRRQFARVHLDDSARSNPDTNGGIADVEEEEARQSMLRQMEERWIESTVMASEAHPREHGPALALDPAIAGTSPPNSDTLERDGNEDLLLGLVVGVFLGAVAVVFIALDSSVFSKPQKMAMIAGVFINFSFAVVRGQWL